VQLKVLRAQEMATALVVGLGLDRALPASDYVVLAALLRRAAALMCPCPPRALKEAARQALRDVSPNEGLGERIDDVLERLLAQQDLVEQVAVNASRGDEGDDAEAKATRLVYAAPPSFVMRPRSGTCFLLGVVLGQGHPDGIEGLRGRVTYVGASRRIKPATGERLDELLRGLGLVELSLDQWTRAPQGETAERHLELADGLLSREPRCSARLEGLQVLDPTRDVKFYKGRWVDGEQSVLSGRFVARRSRRFGAPLWCYVELNRGEAVRQLLLPRPSSEWRACDEAWRLQAAIDSVRRTPQVFSVRDTRGRGDALAFQGPIPGWAERRLATVAEWEQPGRCLFAYRFADPRDLAEEVKYLTERCWLQQEAT
jgi:hypothetical protein